MARNRKGPGAVAAHAGRRSAARQRSAQVEELLSGQSLDPSGLSYDFDAEHVALVASGSGANRELSGRTDQLGLQTLTHESQTGALWCWLGSSDGLSDEQLDRLTGPCRDEDCFLAIGEPGSGMAGWRLSHRQAVAALSIAMRGADLPVRYRDVALLATAVKDDLLLTSLRRLYLEPLECGRGGGELRATLRAVLGAGGSLSGAGRTIGVTRQAVARRVRDAERRLGQPLAACAAELELALRFEELEEEPTPPSAT